MQVHPRRPESQIYSINFCASRYPKETSIHCERFAMPFFADPTIAIVHCSAGSGKPVSTAIFNASFHASRSACALRALRDRRVRKGGGRIETMHWNTGP
jgi:hypothetical protein